MDSPRRRTVGVIPAAGRGSRLAPYPCPKELFPLGWQPYSIDGEVHRRPKVVSQYVVESMVAANVDEIFFIVGDRKHDIMRYFGDGTRFGTRIAYLFQERPEGMVQAVRLASHWIGDSRVLFGMPDTVFYPADAMVQLSRAHAEHGADLSLGLFKTARPWKFGMVDFDESGLITAHVDKPLRTSLTWMWGVAVWEPAFSALIQESCSFHQREGRNRELVLGDVIDVALERGLRVYGHPFTDGRYIDVGTYDEVLEAQEVVDEISGSWIG